MSLWTNLQRPAMELMFSGEKTRRPTEVIVVQLLFPTRMVTKEVRCNSSRNGDLDALLQAINALPDAASLFVDATGISMQSLE